MDVSGIRSNLLKITLLTLFVGVLGGVAGTFLGLLLRAIQHIAFGYSPGQLVSNETFLQGVEASSPWRRVTVLTLCGFVAGFGWWALFRYFKKPVSIAKALESKKPMPFITTFIHALLQIITVALGSPLGRETAPREWGVIFSQKLVAKAGLTVKETTILMACGAGAGFAAVYNIPFGGALFVLEVLLCTLKWEALIPAFVTSIIATLISWGGIGNIPQYHFAHYELDSVLIVWSIFAGPIIGFAAFWFIKIARQAQSNAVDNKYRPLMCLLNFMIIGCLAVIFPAILGNGKSPAQLEFSESIGIGVSLLLLFIRILITWSSLKVGSFGGLLTPSLANGALMGVVLGGVWNYCFPGTSLNAYAVVGATAFLASAQKMPLTAIVLMFEFTHIKLSFLMPILIAVSGAIMISKLCANRFPQA